MNASYFVLTAIVLAFATGLFVASIIWILKWFLMPKENIITSVKSIHFLHIFTAANMKNFGLNPNEIPLPVIEDLGNKELYKFNHGQN